ncbi:MAG: ornithine cyclodeaminase family protein [Candidatus Mcinerneyibacterium aminivorans]|uniref:Ornithine cyclodeaminase family protein n=1 Tax=Candidatus Mcinerneyibacterium aminivorans TaxID=2703815 RepID=A0A5D0MGU3_9BACT|nr:MAG: ornithine cyclodeaminase family protein [Candidatus Mcinerneyibacterium aminivorans]
MAKKNNKNTSSERKPIKLIKRSEIAKNFTMAEAIDSMADAFASLSSGDCYVPKRYIINSQDEKLTFLLKPAFVNNRDKASIKILTQKNQNINGIPTILGVVLLIDNVTGEILSLMDGEIITALRTGAASGLATKYLSRKDSTKMALFGCGTQGKTQLKAVNEVRNLEKIWIFDKSKEAAELFAREMSESVNADIEIADNLSVLKDVDIICTATNSESPLFYKKHIKKGTHINAIGSYKPEMQELDPELIKSSLVYFDDKKNCLGESGDFKDITDESRMNNEFIIGEIGECVLKEIEGRTSSDEITIFKSVGTAIQDLIVANIIYDKSLIHNFGKEIKLYE